jgi:hypothetical protein
MGVQSAIPLSSLSAGHVEVLLGSRVTAQAPGLEMFGADTVDASDYVSAAQQDNQSVPANVRAAAEVGSSSDVPAYSKPKAASSSRTSSVRRKSSSSPSNRHARNTPAADPSPLYGLTTCPY